MSHSDDRDLGDSLDLPFETQAPTPLADQDVRWSGGVVVMAATVPVPGSGVKPALVFRFAAPDGTFHPPVVLVADPGQLGKLTSLVAEAVDAATAGAGR